MYNPISDLYQGRSLHSVLRFCMALWLLTLLAPSVRAATLKEQGNLAYSWQFDAAIDAQGVLHLVADRYYRFDLSGALLSIEDEVQDQQQYNLAFPPSLALDPQGNANVLVRGAGDVAAGVDIHYRVRDTGGDWSLLERNYSLGSPEPRNYVVAVAAVSDEIVYAHHGKATSGVQGDLVFWKLNDTSPEHLGNWSGVWRADLDTRMHTRNGKVYFASANMVSSSSSANRVYFSLANANDNLLTELKANVRTHSAGSGRRGGPDLRVDQAGNAHLVYGAYQEVYYNRYRDNGSRIFAADKRILNNLGSWYLNFGIASLGVSEDGSTLLVAGLKSDGTKLAHNSELLLTWSTDGGASWSEPLATGIFTHGGESRMRPRILTSGSRFHLVYFDWAHTGLALASVDMNRLTGPADTSRSAGALSAVQLLLFDREED